MISAPAVNKISLITIIGNLAINFDVNPANKDPKKAPNYVNDTQSDFSVVVISGQ